MPKGAIESPDIPALGPRIRELRLRKGWSQEALAERVGVRQKQISSYERGVNVPSGEILIALAKAFDVSLDYLAQMAPLNAQQVAIADLDLVEKVQLVDKLGDEERQLVKNVMDLVVMKGRVRALADELRPLLAIQVVGPDGQMGPVLLEGPHGDDDHVGAGEQLLHLGPGHVGQVVSGLVGSPQRVGLRPDGQGGGSQQVKRQRGGPDHGRAPRKG